MLLRQQSFHNMSDIFAAILEFSDILFSAKTQRIFLKEVETYVYSLKYDYISE